MYAPGVADVHGTWQALEPLYTEGEAIEPYEWVGAHTADYDPESQNAWGDLPMAVSAPPARTRE
jgi:hypothetical protein